jgi:4-hydroxy-tetrahydrodipicolinate reductase
MKKSKVCLVGANGRMGKEITNVLKKNQNLIAQFAVSRSKSIEGFNKTTKSINDIPAKDVDVIIDFSSPELLKKSIQYASKNGVPIVIGVTGLAETDLKFIKEASKKTAVLYSPNMSIGVAILKACLSHLSEINYFDFQIIESHHKHKKDSPSGTALHLQKSLEKNTRKTIPKPLSIRAGGIIGEHEVLAISDYEKISFKHTALNRAVFAEGSLKAAEWIIKNKNGLFEMEDVLRTT